MRLTHAATFGELAEHLERGRSLAPLDPRDIGGAAARERDVALAEPRGYSRRREPHADPDRIVDMRDARSVIRHPYPVRRWSHDSRDAAELATRHEHQLDPVKSTRRDTSGVTPRDEWSSLDRGSSLVAMIELATEKKATAITARQREVVALIAAGCSNDEVGARLGISPRTAKAHCDVLRQKLGVTRRRQIPIAFRLLTGEDPLSVGQGWPLAPRHSR